MTYKERGFYTTGERLHALTWDVAVFGDVLTRASPGAKDKWYGYGYHPDNATCLSRTRTTSNLRVIPWVKNAIAYPWDWMLRYKQPVAVTYISLSYTRTHASKYLRSHSPLEAPTLPVRENSVVLCAHTLAPLHASSTAIHTFCSL